MLQKFPDVPKPSTTTSEAPIKSEPHLTWNNLSESFAMNTIGQELYLTETAISVAEAALCEEVSPMDISFNDVCEAGNDSSSWLSYQQSQLEAAATEVLGVELALAEIALNVAEAALENEYKDYFEDAKNDRQDKREEQMDEEYYSDYNNNQPEEDYDY
jgi:hypothetical protein